MYLLWLKQACSGLQINIQPCNSIGISRQHQGNELAEAKTPGA